MIELAVSILVRTQNLRRLHGNTEKIGFIPSEDTHQPRHISSLIKILVFAS